MPTEETMIFLRNIWVKEGWVWLDNTKSDGYRKLWLPQPVSSLTSVLDELFESMKEKNITTINLCYKGYKNIRDLKIMPDFTNQTIITTLDIHSSINTEISNMIEKINMMCNKHHDKQECIHLNLKGFSELITFLVVLKNNYNIDIVKFHTYLFEQNPTVSFYVKNSSDTFTLDIDEGFYQPDETHIDETSNMGSYAKAFNKWKESGYQIPLVLSNI